MTTFGPTTDGSLLGGLWCTAVLPLLTLPWIFIAGLVPPSRVVSHATFHLLYPPLIAVATWFALRLARSGGRRALRVLAGLVAATQAVGLVGHLGELWVVLTHGGFDAPESVFDLPAHAAYADVTPLALLLGAVLVLAATAVWASARRRARAIPGT